MTKTKVLFGHYKIWRFAVSLEWCIKDMWVGLYWENEHYESYGVIDLYFIIFPCLPIHFRYMHPKRIYDCSTGPVLGDSPWATFRYGYSKESSDSKGERIE